MAKVVTTTEAPPHSQIVRELPVAAIRVGEQMLRADPHDESIIELAASIAQHGLLQPIGVTLQPDGHYQLLFGGRRLAAHQRLGRQTILARVLEPSEASVKTVALTENLQRLQMTLQEECDAVAHLHYTESLSPDQIAVRLAVKRPWVLRRLALPGLPADLRDPVFDGTLPIGSAEEIARLADPSARAYCLQHAIAGKLSIAQVRAMREIFETTPSISAAVAAGEVMMNAQCATTQIYLACEACGVPLPTGELRIVRVCAAGCEHTAARRPEQ